MTKGCKDVQSPRLRGCRKTRPESSSCTYITFRAARPCRRGRPRLRSKRATGHIVSAAGGGPFQPVQTKRRGVLSGRKGFVPLGAATPFGSTRCLRWTRRRIGGTPNPSFPLPSLLLRASVTRCTARHSLSQETGPGPRDQKTVAGSWYRPSGHSNVRPLSSPEGSRSMLLQKSRVIHLTLCYHKPDRVLPRRPLRSDPVTVGMTVTVGIQTDPFLGPVLPSSPSLPNGPNLCRGC